MDATITEEMIAEYLAAIEASGVLGKSERRLRLITYLIRAEVRGEGDDLKAYSIGLDVFDKPDSFDPSSDSIVRVEIGRLRAALALFEASEFANVRLKVEIPVGRYRPLISQREQAETPAAPNIGYEKQGWAWSARVGATIGGLCLVLLIVFGGFLSRDTSAPARGEPAPITVFVHAFTGDQRMASRARGILLRALARSKSFEVRDNPLFDETGGRGTSAYVLSGSVNPGRMADYRVAITLLEHETARVIWSKSALVQDDEDIEAAINTLFTSELRVRLFGSTKRALATRDVSDMTAKELFVMATWVPGPAENAAEWEQSRVDLMREALKKDADFGLAHSVMADKLAYLANVHPPANTQDLRQEAAYHIQRARELAPFNPDAMFNLAQGLWHSGRIKESHIAMGRVVELDRGHQLAAFLHLVTPYTCSVPPQEVIDAAVAFDEALAPDNPIRWITLTWVSWLYANRQDYAKALAYEERAALVFETPYTFMRHAMLLNMLDRPLDAAKVLARQRTNWPQIDARFFAETIYPRLCAEAEDPQDIIAPYVKLAEAMSRQ